MIEFNYYSEYIEIFLSNENVLIPFEKWLYETDSPTLFNVVNDLIVNGIAVLEKDRIKILYEDLIKLDDFEYSALNLPDKYPFDIFIDINGSGLKDLNLKLTYSFQDFANKNGSGNILFKTTQLNGAILKGNFEYLLNSNQFLLIKEIKKINNTKYSNSNELLTAISSLQSLAFNAGAVLSKILYDTIIVVPEKFSLKIKQIDENKFKLLPEIKNIDNNQFHKKFEIHSSVKKEYNYKTSDKKVRILISEEKNQENNSIKSELTKLKKKNTFTKEEINEIYNSPNKFWDTDLIDIDEFGDRVLELGIYKPKFYPFISPYKSQWIPGIAIDSKKEGRQFIPIKNKNELVELKTLLKESLEKGKDTILFKGNLLDSSNIPAIIKNAEKQLNSPQKPITNEKIENSKSEGQLKVLIIKENTEKIDYYELKKIPDNIKYKFQTIDNLSKTIKLKEHQKKGIAWLQTLSTPPYSFPGVLLADDMGLGKTLQVLYFIEWYIQIIKEKPVLVVAPVSLLENWQNEYNKFFPKQSLKNITLWGSNVKNFIITNNKEKTVENLTQKAIFLTTYETLRRQQIPLGLIDWGIVILDEAQKIKTPGTLVTNAAKALKSDFKIAMTGTPVENTLMDLWCIVDFCSPGLLENAKSFSSQYQKPLKKENINYAELAEKLRNKIGDTLLRRMKTDVAKDLPTITYLKYSEIMPEEQFNAYKNELAHIEELKRSSESNSPILQGIFNLRSISDHPYLKHYQIENIETEKLIKTSAKLKKVIVILEEIKKIEEKAIVFTENKSMQRVLKRIIGEYFKIIPAVINGDTPTTKSKRDKTRLSRQQEIDKYQNKPGFNVIIMSPVAAGFGLNITGANHIIHYTRHWNPAKEQQATDRAYRIGQKKPVKVYYPMAISPEKTIKTFDLILDELLNRKSNLATHTLFPTEQIEIKPNEFMELMGYSEYKNNLIQIKKIEDLDLLQPLIFEAAIALLLEKKFGGYTWLTPKSNDKGADIMHFNEKENYLIQVKQSKTKLGIKSGQEIHYALNEYNNKYNCKFKPQIITNSYFNNSAIELAKQNKVNLIDRDTIKKWIVENPLKNSEIDEKLQKRKS